MKSGAQWRAMNAVARLEQPLAAQAAKGGRPRKYDRAALLEGFRAYIETTEIPIIVEWTSQHGITRNLVYDWEEFAEALELCTNKKEASLERLMLRNEINTVGAIFALKQLGWSDKLEQTNKSERQRPEDVVAHLEHLANNLEPLMRRRQAAIDAQAQAEATAPRQGKR